MVWNQHGHLVCRDAGWRMKKLFVFVILLWFVPIGAFAVPATVDYILDGDTFAAYVNLEDDIRISVRVRIMNVDTPELHGECDDEIMRANMARDRLAELIPVGSVVELSKIKDDKYLGRIDAFVQMVDGRDVGNVLIAEKLGRPYSGGRRAGWCNIRQ